MALPNTNNLVYAVKRLRLWYGMLVLIVLLFGLRLFYLQVVQHGHYEQEALQQQYKQYSIPAERGLIEAHDGSQLVPLVLNQDLYTIYVDPKFIKDPSSDADFVAGIIGGDSATYHKAMTQANRYDVLANRVSQADEKKILAAKKPGINAVAQSYRVYPDGELAAPLLGFVNDSGKGNYGIEEALNSQLSGKPGYFKAVTDARGIPLAANKKNVEIAPKPGKNVALTIDSSLQQKAESVLSAGLKADNSKSGAIIVMNPNNGAIVALASEPSYNPAQYYDVTDPTAFNNQAVGSQLEVGSIMKVLTIAAALDNGSITPATTYQDTGRATEDGFTITNVLSLPGSTVSIEEILRLSLNTGAIHVISTLGGDPGNINLQARETYYNYLVNHYRFGKQTGIEQSYEASGSVPSPSSGSALELKYADMAFGQGFSLTMLQMISAFSAVLNGGTYYQPHLVDGYVSDNGTLQQNAPKVLEHNVVKPAVSTDIASLMQQVFTSNHGVYDSSLHKGFVIGGKTGTAQIAVNGNYEPNTYNGTFLGFVGGDRPEYAIAILVNSPNLPPGKYAGTEAAAPLFGAVVDALIDSGRVSPVSN